jgi:glutamate/tyrosine decarboxylase-like PLP-dependent enzyme
MTQQDDSDQLNERHAPANLGADEFRAAGHQLIDTIADFYESLPERPVTRAETPAEIRALLGDAKLPDRGTAAGALLEETAQMLFDHSLHNGHPRFLGYITSSAAPLGALAELLAASVNSNLGKWDLSPLTSEIEAQTVRWIAELIGYPTGCGGIMSSGGNMANFLAFVAARKARADWPIREQGLYGLHGKSQRLTAYGSRETHTWIEKATDVTGLGTDAIRWIETDAQQRMRTDALEERLDADIADGCIPFIVIGTAGNVSTGAVDPLAALADICAQRKIWFHVDGAYGAPAAAQPDACDDLVALARADSVSLDPHKWLYNPIEAGCTLVRDPAALTEAFSFQPSYYRLDVDQSEPGLNYYAMGMQNTRGFRALKVWLNLRHIGRSGYVKMIGQDIALARRLYRLAEAHDELEAIASHLSITNLRFIPRDLASGKDTHTDYLNQLNTALLDQLQKGGETFVSNAIIDSRYTLRTCVVNFRTTQKDIDALPEIIVRVGQELDTEMRSNNTR